MFNKIPQASQPAHPASAPLMLSVSGCRGVVGASLTPEVICRFAGAFAWEMRDGRPGAKSAPTVVVGRDGRRGGDVVGQLALSSLRAAGCRVIDLGIAATPTVGVMVTHHSADAGLVITASHNPAEWNGIKCITRDGCAPDSAVAGKIIASFREGKAALSAHDRLGRLDSDDTGAHVHVARVLKALDRLVPIESVKKRRFRVVVDSLNASGAFGARMLLEALGCEVLHLNNDDSGVFPHPPEPVRENLSDLAARTSAAGADIGFAQDPDADRLAIVDERGRFVGEEYTLALAAPVVLGTAGRLGGACVAVNLSTSRMIDDVASSLGTRVVRTPVGEANVVLAMQRERCRFGGEGNGGVIWPEVVLIRDSISAMALVLAAMARSGSSVSALVGSMPAYAIQKRKLEVKPGLAEKSISAIAGRYAKERVDLQDGVRVDLRSEPAWLHVRASNTEPIIRLIAEATSEARVTALLDEAAAVISRL